MPLFEAKCSCGNKFEFLWSGCDKPMTIKCPVCEQPAKTVDFSVPGWRDPKYGIQ